MNIQPSTVLRGALTFVPGIYRLAPKIGVGTGGTDSAKYCYGVWMKHLVMLHDIGYTGIPQTVAEFGPGDSLGIGIAALLSGADQYFALDIVKHADTEKNLAIFDDLLRLFRARASRPKRGWPDYDALLDDRLFPSRILTEELLAEALAPERVTRIRDAVAAAAGANVAGHRDRASRISVRYCVPWTDGEVIEPGSVDLIFSHSTLEHVVDLPATYRAMKSWLKPGGWMSHQVDFSCHGLSGEWNGYRQYPEPVWKLVLGTRPYLLNRVPYSEHFRLLKAEGFEIARAMQAHILDRGLRRSQLARKWRDLSDDDLTCSGAFLQATKPA